MLAAVSNSGPAVISLIHASLCMYELQTVLQIEVKVKLVRATKFYNYRNLCYMCSAVCPKDVLSSLAVTNYVSCARDMGTFHTARIRDGMENALNLLKKAWDEWIMRFGRVLHESSTALKLFPMPLSTLGAGILIHIEQ